MSTFVVLNDSCNCCSNDCGFHVLLYMRGLDDMDIYDITEVNIEPCVFFKFCSIQVLEQIIYA